MTQRGRAARSAAGSRSGDGPRTDMSRRRLRLRQVVEPVVTAAGYDLEDLSISRAGRRHVVRVIVDGDGGVSLDAVADVSRAVSKALDQAEETGGDLVAGEYQLEVSSPGVDRPLTLPRHWRRNVGRLVRARQVTGRVIAADDRAVVLETGAGPAEWLYADLGPGRVQVEFSRLDEGSDGDPADIDDHPRGTGDIGDGGPSDDEDDEDVEGEER